MPRAGDEDLRERIPDGQERRELPLERRFGADVVTYLNVDELRPLFATKSTSFWTARADCKSEYDLSSGWPSIHKELIFSDEYLDGILS